MNVSINLTGYINGENLDIFEGVTFNIDGEINCRNYDSETLMDDLTHSLKCSLKSSLKGVVEALFEIEDEYISKNGEEN